MGLILIKIKKTISFIKDDSMMYLTWHAWKIHLSLLNNKIVEVVINMIK